MSTKVLYLSIDTLIKPKFVRYKNTQLLLTFNF
jgi:hypothetical protein